jgi:exonuclease VII small subunit
MKVAIIALLLTVSLAYTQCQVPTGSWGGYGGVGVYGGVYGLGYSGLLGSYHNLGFYGKRSGEESPDSHMLKVSQRTECVYTKDSGMLSCHGPTLIVECETELNRYEKLAGFSLFGIAKSDKMFRIIPRKLDNSAWSTEDNLYVYMKGEKKISGLAIKEQECYAKLNELFEDSMRNEKVHLSEKETVYIIGDLMVADKMPEMVIESLETKERQKRVLEEIMKRLDAIDGVLEDEYEETMMYKRHTMEKIEEFEKKML